jgi:hypothetical protein
VQEALDSVGATAVLSPPRASNQSLALSFALLPSRSTEKLPLIVKALEQMGGVLKHTVRILQQAVGLDPAELLFKADRCKLMSDLAAALTCVVSAFGVFALFEALPVRVTLVVEEGPARVERSDYGRADGIALGVLLVQPQCCSRLRRRSPTFALSAGSHTRKGLGPGDEMLLAPEISVMGSLMGVC